MLLGVALTRRHTLARRHASYRALLHPKSAFRSSSDFYLQERNGKKSEINQGAHKNRQGCVPGRAEGQGMESMIQSSRWKPDIIQSCYGSGTS
jgi:hypothetical protein